jgi:hypothetical protein
MYGVRSIIYELSLSKSLERIGSILCFLAGAGLFVFGTYVAIAALFL